MSDRDAYAREVLKTLADKALTLECSARANLDGTPLWNIKRRFDCFIEWRAWRKARALCQFAADYGKV